VVHNDWGTTRTGVNLGNLYQPTVFTREPLPEKKYEEQDEEEPLHLALIKLRRPETLDDRTLGGIALTLSQMAQLGLSTAVVLDCAEYTTSNILDETYEKTLRTQAARFVASLEEYNEPGALLIEHALSFSGRSNDMPSTVQVKGEVEVKNNFLLYPPLDDGVIPVILPFAYDSELKKVPVEADGVLLALIREFAGITGQVSVGNTGDYDADPANAHHFAIWHDRPVLDRIIVLDPLGGIPSENRSDGAHVFVISSSERRRQSKRFVVAGHWQPIVEIRRR
jgi:amino-acid N-acetyltransferase